MLYIVGTPIGNMSDSSLRMCETLINADIILAEDTRTFSHFYARIQELFSKKTIKNQKIVSYYKDKEFEKLPFVLEELKNEKEIVLVSESGMPLVSDPGYLLVTHCIKNELPFTVIPGPTAFITASVLSGFPSKQLMFLGFLPKRENEINKIIKNLEIIMKNFPDTLFSFYESPERINKTLEILNTLIPNAEVCVCRELTKKFEEIQRGKPKDLLSHSYKGEITLLIKL